MKRLLNILFNHRLEEREWYHVIGWWELRRIAFNAIILFSGLISLICFNFIVDGAGDFIHPMTTILFGFTANLFYNLGWVLELFLRLFKGLNTKKIAIRFFKIGLTLTIIGTFLPTILFGVFGIVEGELPSSPYSHFAQDKPDFNELIGTYHLDPKNTSYLTDHDKNLKGQITLNTDSTFVISNYPIFNFFEDYDLCNGSGTWQIDQHSSFNNAWTILVRYDSLRIVETNESRQGLVTDLFIYNNESPYKLYDIVSDPDEWAKVMYEKK
jgi:hypothetical protein